MPPPPGAPPPGPPGYPVPPPGYVYAPPPPPPLSPGGQRLAEFTDRLVARIVDGLILGLLTAALLVPGYLAVFFAIVDPSDPEPFEDPLAFLVPIFALTAAAFLLSLALAYLYEVEAMYRTGQTIGKRVMNIRVIPVDPTQTLTRGAAFKRYLIQHVAAAFVPALNWIDGLWQLWDKPYRQCLHDKFASTLVIKLDA
jgi:uncharacterized RDD family membrane protein YckC